MPQEYQKLVADARNQEYRNGGYQLGGDNAQFFERVFQRLTHPADPDGLNNPALASLQKYIIPVEQRAARKEESDRARRKMIEIYSSSLGRPSKFPGSLGRTHTAVCYYFQQKGQPEMIERFEQLCLSRPGVNDRTQELVAQGVPQEQAREQARAEHRELALARGHLYVEMLEPLRSKYTIEKLLSMTPEEVRENLAEVVLLQAVSMNIEKYVKSDSDGADTEVSFNEEDRQKGRYMVEVYNAANYPLQKLTLRANPNYALLDVDQIVKNMPLEESVMLQAAASTLGPEDEIGSMCIDLYGATSNYLLGFQALIQKGLIERGLDIKQPFTALSPEGKELDLVGRNQLDFYDYWKNGGVIYAEQDGKTAIISVQNIDGQFQVVDDTVETIFNRNYGQTLSDLSAELEDADPWHVRSSDEFKAMKQCFEELKAMGDHLAEGDLLAEDGQERARQKDKLYELRAACNEYLAFKEEKGENGLDGKNDREKKRIAFARKLLDMTAQKTEQLNLPHRAAQAKAEAEQKELRVIRTEAPNLARLEQKMNAFINLPTLPDTPHIGVINGTLKAGLQGLIDSKPDMNALDQPIDRTIGSQEEKMLAYMTVKAMLLNDQAGHTAEKPGLLTRVVGELKEIDSFVTTVRAQPSYKAMLDAMTKKDLYDLAVKGQVKNLAQHVSMDIASLKDRSMKYVPDVLQAQKDGPQKEQKGLSK